MQVLLNTVLNDVEGDPLQMSWGKENKPVDMTLGKVMFAALRQQNDKIEKEKRASKYALLKKLGAALRDKKESIDLKPKQIALIQDSVIEAYPFDNYFTFLASELMEGELPTEDKEDAAFDPLPELPG